MNFSLAAPNISSSGYKANFSETNYQDQNIVETTSQSMVKIAERTLKVANIPNPPEIGEAPRRCVASNVTNRYRCGHNIIEISSSVVDETVKAISRSINRSDYVSVARHIEKLLALVVCGQHRILAESSTNTKWNKSRMDVLLGLTSSYPRVPADDLKTLQEWLGVIAKSEPGSDLKIAKALRSKIAEPLTESDRKNGFIYIFWDQNTFGMVKVGRTNNLERRLKEWNRKCKTTHHYHQSSRSGKLLKVPHVQRIERLMPIELVNYRKKRQCEGCSTTHDEWFNISEAKVVQVFQKWRDCIVREPYALDCEGEWTVRPSMLDTLREVCKPVVFLDAQVEKAQLCRGDRKRQTMPRALKKTRNRA
ncbi:hypothetical protein N0V95_007038 [Ascochyta clinopodiicola]|nr:hypothetical protein N0V95_007038 [Ascochyta clinopodiicola]